MDREEEFEQRLAQVLPDITAICRHVLGTEEFDEGLQQTRVALWEAWISQKRIDEPIDNFRNYAKGVARHTCQTIWRKRQQERKHIVISSNAAPHVAAPAADLDAPRDLGHLEALVFRFLPKSPQGKRQRQAWRLHREGQSQTEIVKKCGFSPSTVSRDLAKVRQWLQAAPRLGERLAALAADHPDPARLREVFRLRAVGHTQAEIAKRCKVSETTVSQDCAYLRGLFHTIITEWLAS